MKSEKGVAGLNILLSVVTLLFVIGLIVMVFSLMGGEPIAGVTDWFPIIIVITAMVVLILLTVIIITAIRGSGLVASA
jgi:uncharacterized membrane protein YhdT